MKKLLHILYNFLMSLIFWDPLYYIYIPAGLLGIALRIWAQHAHNPALLRLGTLLVAIFFLWIVAFVSVTLIFFLKWFLPTLLAHPKSKDKTP